MSSFAAQTGTGYSFPKLSIPDIIQCLSEAGFHVTKEELKQPENHKENIKRLLESLSIYALGLSREELQQPSLAGLSALHQAENHEESVPQMNSLRAIMKMMEVCEVTDFSLRDIISPSHNRLCRQLCAIINFCKFRVDGLEMFNKLVSKKNEYENSLVELNAYNETLSARLTLLKNQTNEEEQVIFHLEKEIVRLEEENISLKQSYEDLENELKVISDELDNQQAKLNQVEEQLSNQLKTQEKLKSQIITNPESLRKEVIEIGQSLQHEQKDSKQAEKKMRDLNNWLTTLNDIHKDTKMAYELMKLIHEETEKHNNFFNLINNFNDTLEKKNFLIIELEQNKQTLLNSINRTEEKIYNMRKQVNSQVNEVKNSYEELQAEVEEAQIFKGKLSEKIEKKEYILNEIEEELQALSIAQNNELNDIKNTYQKIERKIVSHLQSLQKVLAQSSNKSPSKYI